jgi:hypothetical protein
VIELATPALRVDVDPAAGAEIVRVGVPGGANALAHYDWAAPHPAETSASYGSSELDWLSRYRGGWQELIPNAGDACEVDGIPMAFHGDASLAGWDVLAVDGRSCTLRCATRLPLVVERRMRLDDERPILRIEEVVTNESPLDVELLWGHHPVFPATPGARIDLPPATVEAEPTLAGGLAPGRADWPLLPGADGVPVDLREVPDGAVERVLYASELAAGWVALRQPGTLPSVAMSWDAATFRCMWLWLQRGAADLPHFGRAAMLGLEPHVAFPFDGLAAARERGRALRIGPRGTREAWLTLTLFAGGERPVTHVGRDGTIAFERGAVG